MIAKVKAYTSAHATLLIAGVAVIVAVLSIIHSFMAGTIMAYGDAESHINIAKRVTDGLSPGLGQLGGVWLPLHHLLIAPFVTSDFMWRTGLGGSIVSGACFVIAAVFLYKLAVLLTKKKLLGVLAFFIFAANPNILYMLSTPMSELPLLAFMIGSIYFFVSWLGDRALHNLVLAAAFVFAACLMRYDAWFLLFVEVVAIVMVGLKDKWPHQKMTGVLLVFVTLAAFSTFLWLLWSAVIFHDPFYFMNSPYSAKSQQVAFRMSGELPSYHNFIESVQLYTGAAVQNGGVVLSVIGLIGAVVYAFTGKATRLFKSIVILLLVSPFLFNVLALFLGISILFVPGVTPDSFRYHLFNIRYGLMMVPAIAMFSVLLIDSVKQRIVRTGIAVLVIGAAAVFAFTYPVTLADGIRGLSARFPGGVSGINKDFKKYYDHGYIAFDDFSRSANPIELGVPMKKIIYVGNTVYWQAMLKNPSAYARWIAMRKDDTLYRKFIDDPSFTSHYTAVYTQGDSTLYKCTTGCTGWAR